MARELLRTKIYSATGSTDAVIFAAGAGARCNGFLGADHSGPTVEAVLDQLQSTSDVVNRTVYTHAWQLGLPPGRDSGRLTQRPVRIVMNDAEEIVLIRKVSARFDYIPGELSQPYVPQSDSVIIIAKAFATDNLSILQDRYGDLVAAARNAVQRLADARQAIIDAQQANRPTPLRELIHVCEP